MADFTITDGSVEYKHSKPIAEYDSKTPFVRWNFTVAEGSDPFVVTQKLMSKAIELVEGGIKGPSALPVKGHTVEEAKRSVGRPKKVEPADVPEIVEPEQLTSEEATEILDNIVQPILTIKGDVQPLAQKVSAHLAKVDGNINRLRKVIKDCGGTSLLTIPQENWERFIEEAGELLP